MKRFICRRSAALACLLLAGGASAQVIVHGTRQIFPGQDREITVRTENTGSRTSLVQAWVDDGDKQAAPEELRTPFALRPAVFRLDPGRSQVMRVLFTGAALPQDRETMYWLNVLDIPPSADATKIASGNFVQFSLRTRIKLIYRPKGLDQAASAPQQLQWHVQHNNGQWQLQATNPTAYHVNFADIALHMQGQELKAVAVQMVAPFSSETYVFEGLRERPSGNLHLTFINDQGGVSAQSVAVPAE